MLPMRLSALQKRKENLRGTIHLRATLLRHLRPDLSLYNKEE
jgi:hypothetical protein